MVLSRVPTLELVCVKEKIASILLCQALFSSGVA